MARKQRYQNPAVGDQIELRMLTFNSNNLADVTVEQVDVYYLDPQAKTADNPDGRRLLDTISGDAVTAEDTGQYMFILSADSPKYLIGKYIDVWTIRTSQDMPASTINNYFEIFPQLWYTSPVPIVYDFSFHFQPNRLRQGSRQYLMVEVIPNVPRSTDLARYYTNLAIGADLSITIEQQCGDCVPKERDLRVVVDDEPLTHREKCFGYYQLDTEEMECGIYDVTFKMEFGGNVYLSDRMQLQIYK
jgi:hypothetical protein